MITSELSATDLRFVVSRIPKDVRKIMMENSGVALDRRAPNN